METYNENKTSRPVRSPRPAIVDYLRRPGKTNPHRLHLVILTELPDERFLLTVHCPGPKSVCRVWEECTECSFDELSAIDRYDRHGYIERRTHGVQHRKFSEERGWLAQTNKCALDSLTEEDPEVGFLWDEYGPGAHYVTTVVHPGGDWAIKKVSLK